MKSELSRISPIWMEHHCLTAKLQPLPDHPILELLPVLEVSPTECYLQFLRTLPSVLPLWASSGSAGWKRTRGLLREKGSWIPLLSTRWCQKAWWSNGTGGNFLSKSVQRDFAAPSAKLVLQPPPCPRLLHCLLCSPPAYTHPPAHEDPASWSGRRVSKQPRLWL